MSLHGEEKLLDPDSFNLHCLSFPTLGAAVDADILNDEKIAF